MIRSRIPTMGVFLFLLSTGCMSTDVVVSKLQHVMDTVDLESAAWREQVDKTGQELVNGFRAAIAEDLDQVIQRGIGASGVEFRCDVDFIRNRVKQEIQAIIDALLFRPPTPLMPTLCHIAPEVVDLGQGPDHIKDVALYGYDFVDLNESPQVTLKALKRNGEYENVANWLAINSHYQATIALTLQRGRILRDHAIMELQLWGLDRLISQIPVRPFVSTVSTPPQGPSSTLTFRPPLVEKRDTDADFWTGHQLGFYCVVRVDVKAEARRNGNKIQGRVKMRAREWNRDADKIDGNKTEANGWSDWIDLYTAPTGFRIRRLLSSDGDSGDSIEMEKTPETIERGSGLVRRYNLFADHDGPDVGSYTRVEVVFNPPRVELETVDPW